MAYRYRYSAGFGTDVAPAPAAPPQGFTTDPNAYTTPSAPPVPGPSDLIPVAPPSGPPGTSMLPPPPPPSVPSPSTLMPQQGFFDSIKSKLTQPGGPFGIAWRWWLLGGAAFALYRANSGGASSVTSNPQRKNRRSR